MNEPSVSKSGSQSRAGRTREKLRGMFPFVLGILATLLALILYDFLFPVTKPLTQREVNNAIADALASATPRPAFSVGVYRAIQPSLVLVQAERENAEGEKGRGLGTGVIVDDTGSILTSLHVVRGAAKILLTFADGTRSDGIVEIEQPENDIAVLRAVTMPQQYAPATLGNPGSMRVGDDVYVVGNPFGLYGSMSAGVISGFDRTFRPPDGGETIGGLIQFDAAANPGNSGGPLLNRNGHVIGIVMGIVNPTDDSFFVGIGFAVPIGTAAGGLGSPPY